MFKFTPLQEFLQTSPELCPDHYDFSVQELTRSCPAFTEADPFYQTTSLFIGVFSDLREQLSALSIFEYVADILAKESIDLFNHDAIVALQQQAAQTRPGTGTGPRALISVLANRAVTTGSGATLNLNEAFPAMADSLQTIFDALPYLTRHADKKELDYNKNLEKELLRFGQLSNAYRVTKWDWENALWLNFRFTADGEVLDQPEGALTMALRVNNFRYEDHAFALQLRQGKKISGGAGVPRLYQASIGGDEKLPAVKTLIRVFGDTRLRKSVTLNDVFRAYMHIRSVAEEVMAADLSMEMKLQRSTMSREALVSELANKLNLGPDRCSDTLEILTYENPRKSNIWTAPIKIINAKATLALPALAASNVVRFLELTARQRKLSFGEIGKDYEKAIKRKVKDILQRHPFKAAADVLGARTFQTPQGSEEVDLAIRIGSILFAIEVKYDHFPTEPHEIYYFIVGAHEATAQIARKVTFLENNLAVLKQKGLVGGNVESISGLVLNNTMLLSGLSMNGIPIIDEDILESYLKNVAERNIVTGDAIYAVRTTPFYNSRQAFEASAKSFFSDPPQLKRYEAMLSKVKFSRRGGPVRKRGYDIAVYDIPTWQA